MVSKRIKTDDEDGRGADHWRRHVGGYESSPADFDADGPEAVIPPTQPLQQAKISVSKAISEVRGHTSYLPSALLQPFFKLWEILREWVEMLVSRGSGTALNVKVLIWVEDSYGWLHGVQDTVHSK